MRAGKVDAVQADIVRALRAAGCVVFVTSAVGRGFPDLVVSRAGVTYLLEVKSPEGKLTLEQRGFILGWEAPVGVARSVHEALYCVGLKATAIPRSARVVAQSF